MDKDISIRKAGISDIGPIKAILSGALKEYGIAIPDNYSVSDIDSLGAENSGAQIFVLTRSSSVIGFVVLIPKTEDCMELKRLYLTSSERGRSLGEHLLNHAMHFCRNNSYTCIRLETVSLFKEAVSLYKKHGFMILEDVETAPGHDLAFERCLAP